MLQDHIDSQKAKELDGAIKHLRRKVAVLESEERAAAGAGGEHLLEAAKLSRERERLIATLQQLDADPVRPNER